MISLLLLFHITTVVAHPQATLLPKNPSLYFEYIDNLSLQTNHYTVITEIDLLDITAHILGIARACVHEIQCETRTTILKRKYTSVIRILQQNKRKSEDCSRTTELCNQHTQLQHDNTMEPNRSFYRRTN